MRSTWQTWLGGAVLGLAVMLAGCRERSRQPPQTAPPPESQTLTADKLRAERDTLVAETSERLRRLDAQIELLERDLAARGSEARADALEALHQARVEASKGLERAREATVDTWATISTGLEGAIARTEKAYEAALLELRAEHR